MTLRQMKYFMSVCKTNNLTKSARELFISQPTLSVSMKELEREVGVMLFHREGTRLTLTDAGRTLSEEISAVLEQYDRMERLISSGRLERDYVRFGFSTVVGNYAAPVICRSFLDSHPDLRVRITQDSGSNLLWQLERKQLDVVLTGANYGNKPRWAGKFDTMIFNETDMVYCVSAESPIAGKDTITMEEIAKNPVIMPDKTFPVSEMLEKLFLNEGYPLNIILRSPQLFTIERFIATGVAGGFLPSKACIGNTMLVPIYCEKLKESQPVKIGLYWNRDSEMHDSVRLFLSSAKEASRAM